MSAIEYENFCGVGTGTYPHPDEPDNTSSVVSVTPGVGGLFISWTLPLTNPWAVAHYKIYRSTKNDLSTATYLTLTAGDMYFDASDVEQATTYYYWIRVVSVLGTEGPLLGPGWGQMQPTVDDILLILKNQIGVEELFPDLQSLLNEIAVNSTTINQEVVDRISADQLTVSALALTQGELEGTGTLLTSEIIDRIDGDSALASQIDTILVQSGDNAAAIVTEQTVRADGDVALAEAIVALEATIIGDEEGEGQLANQLAIARLDVRVTDNEGDISGNSTSILQLSGSVTNLTTGLNANNQATDQLEVNLAITDGNVSNNAISITDLEAGVADLIIDIAGNATALTNVVARVTTNEGSITAQGVQITALDSTVSGQGGTLTAQGQAIGQLETNSTITDSNVSSNANSITQLGTDIVTQGGLITTNATAITGLTSSVSDNDGEISAISQDVTLLNNSVFDEISGLAAANTAIGGMSTTITIMEGEIDSNTSDIVTLNTSLEALDVDGVASGISANADAISGLGTRVTTNEGSISSQAVSITTLTASIASTDGTVSDNALITQQMGVTVTNQGEDITNLSAQWNIQTNVNGHVAGIGLYNNGATADFIVSVDTFAVVESGVTNLTDGVPKIPFAVGYINGQATIAMDASVFIADATIQTASIGNAVITSALIADAAIINAKIGNIIESTNYAHVPGSYHNGWRLSKDVGIEASTITIYGTDGRVILHSGGVNYSQVVDDNLMKPEDGATNGATWNPESITGLPSDADLLNINTDWSDVAGTTNAPDNNANRITDTSQVTDGAGLGTKAFWSGVTGTGKPGDNAEKNAPSLGIKINFQSFTQANQGECFIHGYDSSGNAANTGGYLFLSNNKTNIASGSLYSAGQTGYLMYQTNGPFNHGGTQKQIGIVKKEGSQWYYAGNAINYWIAFSPNSGAFIVGSVNGAGSDAAGISSAAMWSTGTNVQQIGGIAGIDQITGTNAATYIEELAVDSLQIKGNAISVTGYTSSATPSVTLAMVSDSFLGNGQTFIFHNNGLVGESGTNPETYDMKITTSINGGSAQIHQMWFYAYGPDSWTVTRAATGNNQSISCKVECLMHNTSNQVSSAWTQITGHGGRR